MLMERNFTPTFLDLSVEITLNGLVASFTEVCCLASFVRNLASEYHENIILMTS